MKRLYHTIFIALAFVIIHTSIMGMEKTENVTINKNNKIHPYAYMLSKIAIPNLLNNEDATKKIPPIQYHVVKQKKCDRVQSFSSQEVFKVLSSLTCNNSICPLCKKKYRQNMQRHILRHFCKQDRATYWANQNNSKKHIKLNTTGQQIVESLQLSNFQL